MQLDALLLFLKVFSMDGLRSLSGSSDFPLHFEERGIESAAVYIAAETNGDFVSKRLLLKEFDLPNFFRDHSNPATRNHGLRLASVSVEGPGRIYANQLIFEDTLQVMGLDPWVEHLIRTLPYGFHYSEHNKDETVATYFLGTSFVWSVWSCRHDAKSRSFTTKCLILNPVGSRHHGDPDNSAGRRVDGLFKTLDVFKDGSHSALYLPFVFAVHSLKWREKSILAVLNIVRDAESRTGHGSWGSGHFEEKRDSIPRLTAELGSAFNTVGNTTRHLNIIESIFDYLEELEAKMASAQLERIEGVRASSSSILSAINILRRQCTSAREQCTYLELRIRNQSSVVGAPKPLCS